MRNRSLLLFAAGVSVCAVIPVHAPTARPVDDDGGSGGSSAALNSSLPPHSTPKRHAIPMPTIEANVDRTAAVAPETASATDNAPLANPNVPTHLSKLPLGTQQRAPQFAANMLRPQRATFIENRGQFPDRVKYQLRTGRGTAWLTNKGVVFDFLRARNPVPGLARWGSSYPASDHSSIRLRDLFSPRSPFLPDFLSQGFPDLKVPDSGLRTGRLALPDSQFPSPESHTYDRLVFSEEFLGANSNPEVEARGCQPGIYNYFIGNDPKKWHTRVKGYSEIVYRDVWDGVDLRIYGNRRDLEQEFVVHPGADLSRVQVAYKGIDRLEMAEDGLLVVETAFGELRESKPRIYQEIAGQRVPIEGHFKLLSGTIYTFDAKAHDSEYALVIDPTLLYSTFVGGSALDYSSGIAVDSSGDSYVVASLFIRPILVWTLRVPLVPIPRSRLTPPGMPLLLEQRRATFQPHRTRFKPRAQAPRHS